MIFCFLNSPINLKSYLYFVIKAVIYFLFNSAGQFLYRNCSSSAEEKPIIYSKSAASRWQAKTTRLGRTANRLWYEPYVIAGSLTVFLIYFCVLREENDIDQELGKTLYSRISGLEEKQLEIVLQYNKEKGLSTENITERLEDIRKSKENN